MRRPARGKPRTLMAMVMTSSRGRNPRIRPIVGMVFELGCCVYDAGWQRHARMYWLACSKPGGQLPHGLEGDGAVGQLAAD